MYRIRLCAYVYLSNGRISSPLLRRAGRSILFPHSSLRSRGSYGWARVSRVAERIKDDDKTKTRRRSRSRSEYTVERYHLLQRSGCCIRAHLVRSSNYYGSARPDVRVRHGRKQRHAGSFSSTADRHCTAAHCVPCGVHCAPIIICPLYLLVFDLQQRPPYVFFFSPFSRLVPPSPSIGH